MQKYHTAIGLPSDVTLMTGWWNLAHTNHADERLEQRQMTVPNGFAVNEQMYHIDPHEAIKGETTPHVFEACVKDDSVVRLGVRYQYDETHDQTLVFDSGGTLVTVWLDDEWYVPSLSKTEYDTPVSVLGRQQS